MTMLTGFVEFRNGNKKYCIYKHNLYCFLSDSLEDEDMDELFDKYNNDIYPNKNEIEKANKTEEPVYVYTNVNNKEYSFTTLASPISNLITANCEGFETTFDWIDLYEELETALPKLENKNIDFYKITNGHGFEYAIEYILTEVCYKNLTQLDSKFYDSACFKYEFDPEYEIIVQEKMIRQKIVNFLHNNNIQIRNFYILEAYKGKIR